jgi:hypothetical protein
MWRSVLLSLMFQSARKLHVACAPWCRDDNSWFHASSGGGSASNKEGPDWTLNQISMIINYFNTPITVHSLKKYANQEGLEPRLALWVAPSGASQAAPALPAELMTSCMTPRSGDFSKHSIRLNDRRWGSSWRGLSQIFLVFECILDVPHAKEEFSS